jgi:hypothetical protein
MGILTKSRNLRIFPANLIRVYMNLIRLKKEPSQIEAWAGEKIYPLKQKEQASLGIIPEDIPTLKD